MGQNSSLNPKILRKVKENSTNTNINTFIEKLLFIEAEKAGNWRWKQEYKTLIEDFSMLKKEGVDNK